MKYAKIAMRKTRCSKSFLCYFFFSHDADVAERSVGEITSWPRLVVTSEKGFVIVWINYMNTF